MAQQPTTLVESISKLFASIASFSLNNRWWVFASCVILLGISMLLASNLRMDNGFESFFDAEDSAYAAYNQYRADFGSDEVIYILYHLKSAQDYDPGKAPPSDNAALNLLNEKAYQQSVPAAEIGIFDQQLVKDIEDLTRRIEIEVPFVKKVRSLSNAELTIGDEEGLNIFKLEEELPLSQDELFLFSSLYLNKPLFLNNLLSEDLRYGAIMIEMSRSSTDAVEQIRLDPEAGDALDNLYPQVSNNAVRALLTQQAYNNIAFYISGDVPLNSAYNEIVYGEMATLGLTSFIVIALLLAIFFRGSPVGIIGPLAIVFLALMMTAGFMGLMGWDIDMMFGMTPTLLTAVGVAHSVHIISEFKLYLNRYGDVEKAIKETLYMVGAPCLLTSLTTAAGFLAMSISPIKTISHMAVYISLAVLFAFFLSITLLSFILSFSKKPTTLKTAERQDNEHAEMHNTTGKLLAAIANFVIGHKGKIIAVSLGIFITAGWGIQRLSIDSNFLLDFSEDVEIRTTTEFIDNTMGGTGSIVYLFDASVADGIKDPAFLKQIEALQQFADTQQHIVKKSHSIVDVIKDLNQSFHGNDASYYRIPDSRELIAQYLLIYEMSGGEELSELVSSDYSRATLELRTRLTDTSELNTLAERLEDFSQQQGIDNSTLTGIGALWLRLVDHISNSQIRGITLALVIITLMMCFIFRSIKVGLISMIPNVTPVVITLGIMGWAEVPLDYMKLLIATVAIGIAVDDTIHMMMRFHHQFKRLGNYEAALKMSFNDVGRALIITSITLIAGFLVFTLSVMDSQWWFGVLLASTIFIALIADFLLMPALLLAFKPFGKDIAMDQDVSNTSNTNKAQ